MQVNHDNAFAGQGLKAITLIVALVLIAFSSACSTRSIQGAVVAQAAAVTASPAPTPVARVRHVCGAKTKAGTACKNPVKAEGARCHLHAGQPVLCGGDADCEKKNPGLVSQADPVEAEYVRVVSAIARTMRCSTPAEYKAGHNHECDPSEIEQDAGLVDADGQILR